MMKIKKYSGIIICCILAFICILAFTACGGGDSGNNGGTQQGGDSSGNNAATVYTLEAEKIDLSYVVGGSSSATPSGKDLITDYATASGGKMIFSLYRNGLFLEFEFESDKADDNATLSFVFMASYHEFDMTDDEVQIYVNPELNDDYEPVDSDTRIKYGELTISDTQLREYRLTENMKIKKGKNIVYLYVNNTDSLLPTASTMNAKAPDIDCMKISTTATITHTTY